MIRKTTPQEVLAERNQATKDYHDDQLATRERTAKLRAERLARDAEELRNPQPKEPPVKGRPRSRHRRCGKRSHARREVRKSGIPDLRI